MSNCAPFFFADLDSICSRITLEVCKKEQLTLINQTLDQNRNTFTYALEKRLIFSLFSTICGHFFAAKGNTFRISIMSISPLTPRNFAAKTFFFSLKKVIYMRYTCNVRSCYGQRLISRNVTGGRTHALMDGQTDGLWYEINVPFF